jgi:hypothetical protein
MEPYEGEECGVAGREGTEGTEKGSTRRDYERAARVSSLGCSKPEGGCDDRNDPPRDECSRADAVCGI